MLKTGLIYRENFCVLNEHTAKAMQSGGLDVLASPVLIAWMEKCAWQSVLPDLEQGTDTVGTFIEMQHLSATPVGMTVECVCELTSVQGRELTFEIQAKDEKDIIAKAVHKRFIINTDSFLKKVNLKSDSTKA